MINTKKRRPKGMGSVTYLGKGRKKPFLAIINKQCLGTYKTAEMAEKVLLKHTLDSECLYPLFTNGHEKLKDMYTDFIYDLQKKGIIDEAVTALEEDYFETFNEMFKVKLISNGNMIESSNSNETIIMDESPTFKEIWDIEYDRLEVGKSYSWRSSFNTAFKNLEPLHNLKICEIKTKELQSAFDIMISKGHCGKSKLNNMRIVCNRVFDYAIKMDYILKDYTKYIISNPNSEGRNKRKSFTVEEIKALINDNTDESKKILIYIFTGARPIELLSIKRCDVHLDENYIVGGVKTKSGKNRFMPIHPIVKPMIKYFLDNFDYEYIFSNNSPRLSYNEYLSQYHVCMERLGLSSDHQEPYDTRHTFSTLAKTNHMETSSRKKIMGHSCNDITDDVYTHEPVEYLYEEIKKIQI